MKLLVLRESSEYSEVMDIILALKERFSVVEVSELTPYVVALEVTQYSDDEGSDEELEV